VHLTLRAVREAITKPGVNGRSIVAPCAVTTRTPWYVMALHTPMRPRPIPRAMQVRLVTLSGVARGALPIFFCSRRSTMPVMFEASHPMRLTH
jgi:hypothetical protein